MVMEVDEPFVKKKSAKKNGNVNSRLTTTGITMVAANFLEIAASNVEKWKFVMKPIAKTAGVERNAEFGKSNIEKGKVVWIILR